MCSVLKKEQNASQIILLPHFLPHQDKLENVLKTNSSPFAF